MRGVAPVLASQTINVAASSLAPATQVDVTVNGVTQIVAASALSPTTQVAVPHVAAFQPQHIGNSGKHGNNGSVHGSGDNNGNQNEHDHAVGRSAGVGGHSGFR
ncbi:hypothetical protein FD733_00525 [Pantoea sp. Eser]|nr:hypothetical protein [Pantoea sp. Eser]